MFLFIMVAFNLESHWYCWFSNFVVAIVQLSYIFCVLEISMKICCVVWDKTKDQVGECCDNNVKSGVLDLKSL